MLPSIHSQSPCLLDPHCVPGAVPGNTAIARCKLEPVHWSLTPATTLLAKLHTLWDFSQDSRTLDVKGKCPWLYQTRESRSFQHAARVRICKFQDWNLSRCFVLWKEDVLSHGAISKVYYSLTPFAVKHYMQESAYKNIWCFGLSPSLRGHNLSPRCNGLLLAPLSPSYVVL